MTEVLVPFRMTEVLVSFRMTDMFVYSGGLIMSVLNDRDVLLL